MKNLYVWVLMGMLFSLSAGADTPVHLRRICKDGTSNILYFTPSSDPCVGYFQYKVWGRNGPFGPFLLLDSITVRTQDEYTHINANPIGNPTKWFYFIEITDSCPPDFSTLSDTIVVDEMPPDTTFIEFVTVDPVTNIVQIGWRSNTSPDFSYYILYKDSSGVYVPVYTGKDTLTFDNNPFSKPAQKPITYDISPVDSCGNSKVFGVNPHTTIHLQQKTDTCKYTATLNWTPYIGWEPEGVEVYHIYKKTESGTYILIDSVFPPLRTFVDSISLGVSYSYYILAIQSGNRSIKSSSNSIQFTTRFRFEPTSSYLALVSLVKPDDEQILVRIYNPNEESAKYDVFSGASSSQTNTLAGSLSNPGRQAGMFDLLVPYIPTQKYYRAIAYNACNQAFPINNTSRYITLVIQSSNTENRLSWDPYFTWNIGVDEYNIYRGTSDENGIVTYDVIGTVSGMDSTFIDSALPPRVGEVGFCYYIEAVQAPGDVNPGTLSSFSTTVCVTGEFTVFVPTAFRPEGSNKTFRPEGSYIDYDASRMEIYNRWGSRLVEINGIRNGWDGKDSNGVYCMQGVYFYKIYITSTNGIEKTVTGSITLLN